MKRRGFLKGSAALGVAFGIGPARAALPVTVMADPARAGKPIPDRFLGLSYETEMMRGPGYFDAGNAALVRLFRTIGVKSLRIGGNSVDSPVAAPPQMADVDRLFDFAHAADARVIYSLRLKDGDPALAAQTARHIHDRHGDVLDSFAIGNEPEEFLDLAAYHGQWSAIREAVSRAVPEARFSGPDTNPRRDWEADAGARLGHADFFTHLNLHSYVGGCSYRNPTVKHVEELIPIDTAVARAAMLSPAWYDLYKDVRAIAAAGQAGNALPFRLSETNNFWYGGLHGVSDSMAAALWGTDYLHWWAQAGALGVNFHTGDRVGGGTTSLVSRYAAFVTRGTGYDVRPMSYGMTLFALGGTGRMVPVTMRGDADGKLACYATLLPGELRVTLINKSYGVGGTPFTATLPRAGAARAIALTAPGNDAAAQSGLLLGGQPIAADGTWTGGWTPLAARGRDVLVDVPPASALVVAVAV